LVREIGWDAAWVASLLEEPEAELTEEKEYRAISDEAWRREHREKIGKEKAGRVSLSTRG
jgi:hypothetical protein